MKKKSRGVLFFDDSFSAKISGWQLLPYFHTCEAYDFRGILIEKCIKPTDCPEYGEKLVYLFNGKPCYKLKDENTCNDDADMPAVLIFKPEYISDIYRMAPFDTGGFTRYDQYMHRKMRRENFHLTPKPETILQTMNFFYKSRMDYFNLKPKAKEKLKFDPFNFEVNSYVNLIHSKGKTKFDDRRGAIEVQLNGILELNKDSLAAVIMPENLVVSPLVKKVLIDEIGAKIIPITNYGVPSNDYYIEVLEKAKQFMIDNYGL